MKGQKEIIEFVLLSTASFLILTMITLTFHQISGAIFLGQTQSGLQMLAEEVSLGIKKAEVASQRDPALNISILVSLPRDFGGNPYTITYLKEDTQSCGRRCLRVSQGTQAIYLRINCSLPLSGELFGSSKQRGSVSYNSEQRDIELKMV